MPVERAREVIPYIKVALKYLDQSMCGPKEVGLLPAYYALLNLAKVYVLLGPRRADLPSQQWHGASYKVSSKDSHSLLTEAIELMPKGAIPLFYETITGQKLPFRKKKNRATLRLRLGDIYPFVSGITAEYAMMTKSSSRFASIGCYLQDTTRRRAIPIVQLTPNPRSTREVKLLIGFSKSTLNLGGPAVDTFSGRSIRTGGSELLSFRKQLRTFLIYEHALTPVSRRRRNSVELPPGLGGAAVGRHGVRRSK